MQVAAVAGDTEAQIKDVDQTRDPKGMNGGAKAKTKAEPKALAAKKKRITRLRWADSDDDGEDEDGGLSGLPAFTKPIEATDAPT